MPKGKVSLDTWLTSIGKFYSVSLPSSDLEEFLKRNTLDANILKKKSIICPNFSQDFKISHSSMLTKIFTSSLFHPNTLVKKKTLKNLFKYLSNLLKEFQIDSLTLPCFQLESDIWKSLDPIFLKPFLKYFKTTITRSDIKIYAAELLLNESQSKAIQYGLIFSFLVISSQSFLEKLFDLKLDPNLQIALQTEQEKKKRKVIPEEAIHRSLNFHIWKDDICIYQLIEIFYKEPPIMAMIVEILSEAPPSRKHRWKLGIASFILHRFPEVEVSDKVKSKLHSVPARKCAGTFKDFGPLNVLNELKLSIEESQVIFIDSVKILENVQVPGGFIGLDSEWRSNIFQNRDNPVSILQIAFEDRVLIIDLLALNKEPALDTFLSQLFEGNSIKIGVSFDEDLVKIKKHYPHLKAAQKKIEKLVDLIEAYKRVYLEAPGGLAGLCYKTLGMRLSKYEQRSNWENRPLRRSQLHYAALDAFVQIEIFRKISESSGIPVQDFFEPFTGKSSKGSKFEDVKRCKICFKDDHIEENCRF